MTGGYLQLPTDEMALAEAIRAMVDAAVTQRVTMEAEWAYAHYYLQGYRDHELSFNGTGYTLRFIRPREDKNGQSKFRYEELTNAYRTEVGRMMRAKMGPVSGAPGFGLDATRRASIGQAELSYMYSQADPIGTQRLKRMAVQTLVKYGTVGLNHYRGAGSNFGNRTCVEVVPPQQILFTPAEVHNTCEITGIMRHRYVTYDWLAAQQGEIGEKFRAADESQLEIVELEFGRNPMDQFSTVGAPSDDPRSQSREYEKGSETRAAEKFMRRAEGKKDDRPMQRWVPLTEYWGYGMFPYVGQAVKKAGMVILENAIPDPSSDEERVPCPLSVTRFIDTDSAYGRGLPSVLMGLNSEVERMFQSMFQNVQDIDVFGFTVVPTSTGLKKRDVEARERRKVLMAEPDPVNPDAKVYNVMPETSGTLPAQIIQLGVSAQRAVSGQGEIYQGQVPGRVDSAAALGFLFETGNVNLVAAMNGLADAFVQLYASMMHSARIETTGVEDVAFPLGLLNVNMLGLSLSPDGQIGLEKNPLPWPWEVKLDVEERALRSEQQGKQEGLLMLQSGIISMQQFVILNERHNWGYPISDIAAFKCWERTVLQSILLFNDGQTPGGEKEDGSTETDYQYQRPEVMLEVIDTVINSAQFLYAAKPVKDVFIQWRDLIMNGPMGQFPAGLPNPLSLMGGGPGGGQGGGMQQAMGGMGGGAQSAPALPAA